MGATDNAVSRDRIRLGISDAEQLIGKKQYNLSMVKCRQTLEIMVRLLADNACLADKDLSVTIDDLYQDKWISKTTCDHYHKIRMIGNKAVHEGSDSAYDANQAYHLLAQEVQTFFSEYKTGRHKSAAAAPIRSRRKSRKGRASTGFSLSQSDMLRILIAVFCVVFVIAIIRFILPDKKEDPTGTDPVITSQENPTETATPPETMESSAPRAVYKTNTVLNVRSEPSTSGSKLGQLPADTIVDYVREENDEWVVILYEGQEAYVARQYLVRD